ncbi:MAG: 3-hydroxy-5-phosphonooxypentane-2,4-dione thiolase [Candidatus Altiarchaeales archaeon]|nr:3-hydroxy-5-phosphonooxypentane-2,4-dione thiolase [Candidatus Altiarchaeota archaeon]MBU4267015.1 3-hydroxy-5-phosphonooxypentane-2,4-dione thiolase [Candidatus Altiarchaeota archaeon]MBU4341447.1 3-hydroxy-5-phosphonooxypentane-2,4-dione thiolase [Candidatus Altiarchaeota archaeon]MBU4436889.1 3-hydroxy-5-phosphonooxypentane-2,4-dione thiolase [Candidatus Altiarchaeota archaeon]MCG2782254.1 3-hydroxy-5-phosphonooxypentane-2,4-dione thiolase [Candidatus Altiarchaeales archaeon]
MDWGMRNRLSRIIKPKDGRTVMLAVDHGYFLGPTTGLENLKEAVEPLLPYADCLMPTRGGLRNYIDPNTDIPIVLRVSGGTSVLSKEMLREGITVGIEDAIRLNVAGMAFSIMVGSEYERDTLLALTEVIDTGEEYGIPVLAVTAVGKDMKRDARYMSLACRMAAELGVHFVKTYYCEDFEKVVDTCPVPVVIAGGKKIPEKEALEMAHGAIQAGAAGVDMGRNIFQSSNPVNMIKAVRAVVHENATPDEAMQVFEGEGGTVRKSSTTDENQQLSDRKV